MAKFYIVDGSGYIFRAFYALSSLTNSKGLPTNALFGFLRMFGKLLREEKPDYVAVAFDRPEPTFRHELYSEYKANRDECPADLIPQMPYFRTIVSALGIPPLEKAGVEADDIIATLVKHLRSEGHEVVVVSGDKDLLQLVQPGVTVFDAMRDARFEAAGVKEKLGVPPELVADYLAIVGDTSDNVPGIKGVGPKTAVQLLEHFGSLDKVVENVQKISEVPGLRGAKGVQAKIESSLELLRLSRILVGLDTQVEPFASSKLSDYQWSGISAATLRALCEDLEFRAAFEAFKDFPSTDDPTQSAATDVSRYSEKTYTIVERSNAASFFELLSAQPAFAFDTETTGLDVLSLEVVGLSFSWKRHEAYYLPLRSESAQLDAGSEEALSGHDVLFSEEVVPRLRSIFENSRVLKVGYNLKFDLGVIARLGIEAKGPFFDSLIAEHLLHPDRRTGGLKALSRSYLGEEMMSYEDMVGESENIRHIPLERLSKYAAHDADASWALMELVSERLKRDESDDTPCPYRVFRDLEMPLLPILSRMERTGVKLDVPALEALERELTTSLQELEQRIYQHAGHEFNLNSPKQLAVVLFEELQLPTKGVRKNQSGYSTDAAVLELLRDAHPIAAELLDYREIHKLNSTYVISLRRLANPVTGRVHTSFNQAIAATGRLSSSDPNLQNIPIRNERGRKIRKAFAADAGNLILAADYSQIELRVLAHLSEDENLREAFRSGEDIHQKTADELFGRDLALTPEEKKERRRIAKTINFGVVYGMGAFRLAGDLGVSRKEAQNFIDGYFARYPKVLSYYEKVESQIDTLGYSETLFGRRRYVAEIDSSGRDSGYAKRSLQNAPIQGTAAEIIKAAMIRLDTRLHDRLRMVLQVHDELVFEVESSLIEEARELVKSEMESAVQLSVPLVVDVRSGRNWGDAL